MATLKLTDQAVRNLAAPTADGPYNLITWDADISGFGVRVSRKCVRTFFYNYRSPVDRKTQRGKTIGIWTGDAKGLTVAAARDAAKGLRRKVEDGRDPVAEEERAGEEAKAARENSVRFVAERFFAEIGAADDASETDADDKPKRKGRRGKVLKTAKEVKRTLERFLLAKFGKRPISDLTRKELIKLFDDIADDNGPIAANRALAWVKRFFKWAVGKDYIGANPAADIMKPGEERKGDRVLTDAEIREVWKAADALPYPTGHYVKALLLTGRRRTSVATMRRSEIDATRRVWTPGGGTANKGVPELPLFPALDDLLATIAEQKTGDGDYLFSNRAKRDGPLNSFSAVKDDLDAEIAKARKAAGINEPMTDWTLHDLRRTVKTRLAELGVPKEIRDLIMGHARQGMDAVYDHSERREDKRAGLERWGRHLTGVIENRPSNVVEMQRAAQ